MIDLHFYDVRGSLPKEGALQYRKNCDKHVAAESAVMAIELVMKLHPGATIHSVQHRGKIDLAQEIPSDANLTGTYYYCDDPSCVGRISDGITVRSKLVKYANDIWYCPNCIHSYGRGPFPYTQRGALNG